MRPPVTLSLLPVLLILGGCQPSLFRQPSAPVDAYRSFHEQVRRGEFKKAYEALSQATREALAQRARAVADASGGTVKAEPLALFFANVTPPPDVMDVTLLREEGNVAAVRVLSLGQASEVRLVREPSGWKVDLSESLKP